MEFNPASHSANIHDDSLEQSDDDIDSEPTRGGSDNLELHEALSSLDNENSESVSKFEGFEQDLDLSDIPEIREILMSMEADGTNDEQRSPERLRVLQSNESIWQTISPEIQRILIQAGSASHVARAETEVAADAQEEFYDNVDFGFDEDNDDFDEHDDFQGGWSTRRRCTCKSKGLQQELPPVPSPEGKRLMSSGEFGQNQPFQDNLRKRTDQVWRRLLSRELASDRAQTNRENRLIAQGLIPSSKAETIIHHDHRCYSGQFSDDGNFFFSCSQDFRVRMYDTSNPYDWKYYKTVLYPYAQWTITDATLSPDNRFLAYSSIRSHVCLASTDPSNSSEPRSLDFANIQREHRRAWQESHFGIWSVRFSGDGRELVAGTSDNSVYVYDIESNKSILKIPGHNEDVNAVCFGDSTSPHILYSGSDDTLIKVWDRRSIRDKRAAGAFVGHTEGVTYVDSKGDGRYVLSNGKDQSMKLWDIRKMMSTEHTARLEPQSYKNGFDYRFMKFRPRDYIKHPHDCSIVTFRGHTVLKTLIRCHFSPPGSTNSRYVYSGSEDGKVYIYNLDATLAGQVDVGLATYDTRPQDINLGTSSYIVEGNSRSDWAACVRDASWHPNAPIIAATSWNGWGMTTGTCSIHVWNDGVEEEADEDTGTRRARRVNPKLEYDAGLYENVKPSRQDTGLGLRRNLTDDNENETTDDDETDDDADYFP